MLPLARRVLSRHVLKWQNKPIVVQIISFPWHFLAINVHKCTACVEVMHIETRVQVDERWYELCPTVSTVVTQGVELNRTNRWSPANQQGLKWFEDHKRICFLFNFLSLGDNFIAWCMSTTLFKMLATVNYWMCLLALTLIVNIGCIKVNSFLYIHWCWCESLKCFS